MSEQRPAHRRRRAQEDVPQKPHRIVAVLDDEPDWLVTRTSGAAERRAGGAQREKPATSATRRPAATKSEQENRAILRMKNPVPREEKREKETETAARAEKTRYRGQRAHELPEQGAVPLIKKSDRKPVTAKKQESTAKAPRKKLSKKARARRYARIRTMVFGVLIVAVLIAVVSVGAIGGSRLIDIKQTLDVGNGVFYPNISVNGIPLAGMTLDQAADVVTRQVKAQISAWNITLRATDGSGRTWNITGNDLKMQYDVADQLDQLWAIGHTGSSAERYEQVKQLQQEPATRYTTLTYDLSRVNQILTQIKGEVDRQPISATRVDDNSVWPPFTYTDDVSGVELDITGMNEQICAMVDRLESGVVDLTPTPVQAPITRKALEGRIVKLAEYETAIGATSDPGRFINIEVGTKKFDKLIIKSGESVSFNKVAGKRTYSNGYADAPEVAYGDYTMGVGGGICQVSSTLYNAVVNAGLTVTKRTQHSLPSNYVPYGLDATVADDRLDFVFKNSTNADIYISTEYYKKKGYWHCKFTIHGRPDPNGYTYKLESQVKEEIPVPEPTYIPDKDAQYVVYNDEMYEASKGDKGYVVDVYMVTLDGKGKEVSREYQYTDTYKTKAPKIYVGVQPRETPVPADYVMPID